MLSKIHFVHNTLLSLNNTLITQRIFQNSYNRPRSDQTIESLYKNTKTPILSEFIMSWITLFFGDVSRDASLIIRPKCELKVGIFAQRAMVDQASEGLCYQ